jgi:hypothetical protein
MSEDALLGAADADSVKDPKAGASGEHQNDLHRRLADARRGVVFPADAAHGQTSSERLGSVRLP